MRRADDFEKRREHLKDLTDEQLKERFWELANKIVEPMLELGYKYTTPAIERSVLLRMGFSSVEVKPIVEGVMKKGLMGKGAGNVVWRLSKKLGISVREAGLGLAEGKYWDIVDTLFEGGNN
ncbi:ornithine aminomutase subunit alpha [Lutispora thermophila]|uniref:D-ornithine 4,5-aminomutase subunit alpha n=1 Tax=Lutispora thermophila DSM 19022 TaxID=1122184 RepID=A0A1M6HMY0_9FIRM|nr:ornithine aminomutase subunit alpha [Lutispora thermophila]SHJ23529.1 D-ornithine 4,5-aminomutase subunit alpha [Lutispora thermophila DSM 19022]